MKTIEELIDEYGEARRDYCLAHNDDWEIRNMLRAAELQLKRRARDLELALFAQCNGYKAWHRGESRLNDWYWYCGADGDEFEVPAEQTLIPELNDELRERLEREWKEAEG